MGRNNDWWLWSIAYYHHSPIILNWSPLKGMLEGITHFMHLTKKPTAASIESDGTAYKGGIDKKAAWCLQKMSSLDGCKSRMKKEISKQGALHQQINPVHLLHRSWKLGQISPWIYGYHSTMESSGSEYCFLPEGFLCCDTISALPLLCCNDNTKQHETSAHKTDQREIRLHMGKMQI